MGAIVAVEINCSRRAQRSFTAGRWTYVSGGKKASLVVTA